MVEQVHERRAGPCQRDCSDAQIRQRASRRKDFLQPPQFPRGEWFPRGPDQEEGTAKRQPAWAVAWDSGGCCQTEVSLQGQKALANFFFLRKLRWLVVHCAFWLPTWPVWLYDLWQSQTHGGQSAVHKAVSPPSGREGNEPALRLTAGTNGPQGAAPDTASIRVRAQPRDSAACVEQQGPGRQGSYGVLQGASIVPLWPCF